jgi:U3 small nucleolar RNA-associated protein 10
LRDLSTLKEEELRLLKKMATALQRQLAVIASNSTHQLDLKAQKAAHGKSLLFDAKVAASQDFNIIYRICLEGFEELCSLDVRFNAFAQSIFSEQSKSEERGLMTADENKELDSVLENFLVLVSGRLLLKPAQKAVEWLIRRFRYGWLIAILVHIANLSQCP